MANLDNLHKLLNKKYEDIIEEVNKATIECAKLILTDLVINTPVDTSQALSNWLVSIGENNFETVEAWSLGKHGSTYLLSKEMTIKLGSRELNSRKFNETIFITNNIDYIETLNSGSSPQQAAGFVYRAIVVGKEYFRNWKPFSQNAFSINIQPKWIPRGAK